MHSFGRIGLSTKQVILDLLEGMRRKWTANAQWSGYMYEYVMKGMKDVGLADCSLIRFWWRYFPSPILERDQHLLKYCVLYSWMAVRGLILHPSCSLPTALMWATLRDLQGRHAALPPALSALHPFSIATMPTPNCVYTWCSSTPTFLLLILIWMNVQV